MPILSALFGLAVLIASIYATVWTFVTLSRLRRGQQQIQAEIDRVVHALGLPPRPDQAMVRCERCGAEYSAVLTGCEKCGRAKPSDATLFFPE